MVKKIISLFIVSVLLISVCSFCAASSSYFPDNVFPGMTVTIGSYEQDNRKGNGPEPIEWIVLAVEGDSALLISKFALDCQPFNITDEVTNWENSTLRGWLNHDFLFSAFNGDETDIILYKTVYAEKNPRYPNSPAGNDTTDRIFVLSLDEVEWYMSGAYDRLCGATPYSAAKGATLNSSYMVYGQPACWWWLRNPGDQPCCAAIMHNDGHIVHSGAYVYYKNGGVRPAMWVNIG